MKENPIQESMLSLIEASGHWNAFNGPAIVRDLRANRPLWQSALLVGPSDYIYMAGPGQFIRQEQDFSAHRGLQAGALLGYDRVRLAPALGRESELENLVNTWDADSVQWFGWPRAESALECQSSDEHVAAGGDADRIILEIWWD